MLHTYRASLVHQNGSIGKLHLTTTLLCQSDACNCNKERMGTEFYRLRSLLSIAIERLANLAGFD